jgi:hypothetical protein
VGGRGGGLRLVPEALQLLVGGRDLLRELRQAVVGVLQLRLEGLDLARQVLELDPHVGLGLQQPLHLLADVGLEVGHLLLAGGLLGLLLELQHLPLDVRELRLQPLDVLGRDAPRGGERHREDAGEG